MKNKEVLRRLKDAAVATLENYYCGQKVTRVELNGEKYKELCDDLAKDAAEEGLLKIALNSVYGLCTTPNYSSQFAVYSKRDVDLMEQYFTHHYQVVEKAFAEKAVVRHVSYPKVMFNGPCTIFQWGDFKTVVKYVEDKKTKDKFDVDIGLGIALYRYYRQAKSTRKQFDKLAKYLDLYQLADYALDYFCDFSKKKRNGLFNNEPVNGWYILYK